MLNNDKFKTILHSTPIVVIKIGTATLTPHIADPESGYFTELGKIIRDLMDQRKKVIIVSSGAVGYGKRILNRSFSRAISLTEKQALASIGQTVLVNKYREAFRKSDLIVSQVLLSASDFMNRSHYNNLRSTLNQLLDWNIVPIINENDVVATRELRMGDNDTLSASIAGLYPSAVLILLTTVDGFYANGERVATVTSIDEEVLSHAGSAGTDGSGGMVTKLLAGKKILQSGQVMAIASGKSPDILTKLLQGSSNATWFYPESAENLNSTKRWLLHNHYHKAKLTIDEGAEKALRFSSASLLAVGTINISESFKKGDIVLVESIGEKILARGIASIDSTSIPASREEKHGIQIIHRDSMVLL